MSTKAAIWVVVIIVLIAGIWWWSMSRTAVAPADNGAAMISGTGTTMTATSSNPATAPAGVSATDSSNAALQTDLSNIDTQMNGFSSDNANVSSGMSDQEVQQSQL